MGCQILELDYRRRRRHPVSREGCPVCRAGFGLGRAPTWSAEVLWFPRRLKQDKALELPVDAFKLALRHYTIVSDRESMRRERL
jgi:hypothetical protein